MLMNDFYVTAYSYCSFVQWLSQMKVHVEMATTETDRPELDSSHTQSDSEQMELTKPLFENGRYKNPWDTWRFNSFWNFIQFARGRENKEDPQKEVHH